MTTNRPPSKTIMNHSLHPITSSSNNTITTAGASVVTANATASSNSTATVTTNHNIVDNMNSSNNKRPATRSTIANTSSTTTTKNNNKTSFIVPSWCHMKPPTFLSKDDTKKYQLNPIIMNRRKDPIISYEYDNNNNRKKYNKKTTNMTNNKKEDDNKEVEEQVEDHSNDNDKKKRKNDNNGQKNDIVDDVRSTRSKKARIMITTEEDDDHKDQVVLDKTNATKIISTIDVVTNENNDQRSYNGRIKDEAMLLCTQSYHTIINEYVNNAYQHTLHQLIISTKEVISNHNKNTNKNNNHNKMHASYLNNEQHSIAYEIHLILYPNNINISKNNECNSKKIMKNLLPTTDTMKRNNNETIIIDNNVNKINNTNNATETTPSTMTMTTTLIDIYIKHDDSRHNNDEKNENMTDKDPNDIIKKEFVCNNTNNSNKPLLCVSNHNSNGMNHNNNNNKKDLVEETINTKPTIPTMIETRREQQDNNNNEKNDVSISFIDCMKSYFTIDNDDNDLQNNDDDDGNVNESQQQQHQLKQNHNDNNVFGMNTTTTTSTTSNHLLLPVIVLEEDIYEEYSLSDRLIWMNQIQQYVYQTYSKCCIVSIDNMKQATVEVSSSSSPQNQQQPQQQQHQSVNNQYHSNFDYYCQELIRQCINSNTGSTTNTSNTSDNNKEGGRKSARLQKDPPPVNNTASSSNYVQKRKKKRYSLSLLLQWASNTNIQYDNILVFIDTNRCNDNNNTSSNNNNNNESLECFIEWCIELRCHYMIPISLIFYQKPYFINPIQFISSSILSYHYMKVHTILIPSSHIMIQTLQKHLFDTTNCFPIPMRLLFQELYMNYHNNTSQSSSNDVRHHSLTSFSFTSFLLQYEIIVGQYFSMNPISFMTCIAHSTTATNNNNNINKDGIIFWKRLLWFFMNDHARQFLYSNHSSYISSCIEKNNSDINIDQVKVDNTTDMNDNNNNSNLYLFLEYIKQYHMEHFQMKIALDIIDYMNHHIIRILNEKSNNYKANVGKVPEWITLARLLSWQKDTKDLNTDNDDNNTAISCLTFHSLEYIHKKDIIQLLFDYRKELHQYLLFLQQQKRRTTKTTTTMMIQSHKNMETLIDNNNETQPMSMTNEKFTNDDDDHHDEDKHDDDHHDDDHHDDCKHDGDVHDVGNHDVGNHDVDNHGVDNHDVGNHDVDNLDVGNHDVGNHDDDHHHCRHYFDMNHFLSLFGPHVLNHDMKQHVNTMNTTITDIMIHTINELIVLIDHCTNLYDVCKCVILLLIDRNIYDNKLMDEIQANNKEEIFHNDTTSSNNESISNTIVTYSKKNNVTINQILCHSILLHHRFVCKELLSNMISYVQPQPRRHTVDGLMTLIPKKYHRNNQQQRISQNGITNNGFRNFTVANIPGCLYSLLRDKVSIVQSEWFRLFVQYIILNEYDDNNIPKSSIDTNISIERQQELYNLFIYGIHSLRIMGLMKRKSILSSSGGGESTDNNNSTNNTRSNQIVIICEKTAIVWCH